MSGKAWAASSARTLARRLRREGQKDLGATRAQAMAHRQRLFRRSVELHWQLCSKLGFFASGFADAIRAAELLHIPDIDEYRKGLEEGNWARHAPPPQSCPKAAPIPERGLQVQHIEDFREKMYDFYGNLVHEVKDNVKDDELAGKQFGTDVGVCVSQFAR